MFRIFCTAFFVIFQSCANDSFCKSALNSNIQNKKDSILVNKSDTALILNSFKLSLTSLYTNEKNWYNENNQSFCVLFNGDYRLVFVKSKFRSITTIQTALGYFKLVDSTWNKNVDRWRFSEVYIVESSKKLKTTFTITLNSQFLNTYKLLYDTNTDSYKKQRTAAFYNPGTMMLSYGLNYSFWDNNYINVDIATLKFSTKFRQKIEDPNINLGARSKNSYLNFEYGFRLNIYIEKKINDYTKWFLNTDYFMTGIDRERQSLDFRNSLCFNFLKYLEFKTETNIIYNPNINFKLQVQQSFLLGVCLSKKYRRKN
jgi:hypothetical protein